MQIVKLGEQLNRPVVVCLGFFGCMHKGHTALLEHAKAYAEPLGADVALFTFSNNHLAVLGRDTTVIYTFDERLALYNELGVDCVITAQFDDDFKQMDGEAFLSQFKIYNLKAVVCGFDHRCGSNKLDGAGIKKYFSNVCPVDIVDEVTIDGVKVSTTLIRKYVLDNQMSKVNSILSEPFFLIGEVVHGRGVGRTLGFPTANVVVPDEKLLPGGVFSAKTVIDGKMYHAIVNIGNTPTFDIARKAFEVHIIGFNGDLYGKDIKVSIVNYLRPITKFDSPEELSQQLQRDKEAALND